MTVQYHLGFDYETSDDGGWVFQMGDQPVHCPDEAALHRQMRRWVEAQIAIDEKVGSFGGRCSNLRNKMLKLVEVE